MDYTNGTEHDPNEIRYVTADGLSRTGHEEWWEQEVDNYERLGVPSELVEIAKPLLDGNPKEQDYARRFLMERQGTHHVHPTDLLRLEKVVSDRGYTVRPGKEHSDDEFLQAWEAQSGPANDKRGGDFTLGTSKEASNNALARHGYPSGAGAQTTKPKAKFVQQSND